MATTKKIESPAQPTTPGSGEEFTKRLSIFSDAGVGVFAVRTPETQRVVDSLHRHAFVKQADFHVWDIVTGWTTTKPDATLDQKTEKICDPIAAIKWAGDLDGDRSKARSGIFVMFWPHFFVGGGSRPTNPVMLSCLRHYVQAYTESEACRLILLLPEGAQLPSEIAHDIPFIDLALPSKGELREIYDKLSTRTVKAGGSESVATLNFSPAQILSFLNIGAGMTANEFECATARAIVENRATFPNIPFDKFSNVLHATKVEVLKQSEVLELIPTSTTMAEVGGMGALKNWIRDRKVTLTPEGQEAGLDPVKGFVALGPPGTGKSLVARAAAAELGLPLIRFNIGAVYGSLIGESEKRLRTALAMLKAIGKCVVWMDEVDKSGMHGNQSAGDGGVSKRVFGQILTFMDENTGNLFWVATGNWPHLVDPAFARKGRFDEVFAVLPPHSLERLEIFKIHLAKRKRPTDLDLAAAVAASEGFVPAELEAAVKEAILFSVNSGQPLTGAMVADQFSNFKQLALAFPTEFETMRSWASNNARMSSIEPPQREARPRQAAPARAVTV